MIRLSFTPGITLLYLHRHYIFFFLLFQALFSLKIIIHSNLENLILPISNKTQLLCKLNGVHRSCIPKWIAILTSTIKHISCSRCNGQSLSLVSKLCGDGHFHLSLTKSIDTATTDNLLVQIYNIPCAI